VELKKFNTTQLPLRYDKSNVPPPSVVDFTTGAGFPNNGDAADSESPGFAIARTTRKASNNAPAAPAMYRMLFPRFTQQPH
jgi:hypothetical protein